MGCVRHLVAAGLSLALGGVAVFAQTPGTPPADYDPFDYTGTALAGQAGGIGWGGAWFTTALQQPNTLSNDNTSLTYPVSWQSPLTPPPSSGARISTGGLTASASSSRLLASTFDTGVGGNTLYASALFRKNAANGGGVNNDNILIEFVDSAGTRRFGLGIEGTGDKPWLNANGSTSAATSVVAGQTYFIVAKLVAGAGGTTGDNDTAYLKVFAADGNYTSTVPFDEPTTWDATLTEKTGAIFDRFRVRIDQGNTGALPGEVDDIRIGTDWQSVAVVPEPGCVAMLLSGVAVLGRRRRRASETD
jgi:hypothetical protein